MEYAKPENAEEKFVQMFAGHERELARVRSVDGAGLERGR